jgi:hypothetical protein
LAILGFSGAAALPLLHEKDGYMSINPDSPGGRVEREVEREMNERVRNDEARTGLGVMDELRVKDARENAGAANVRRPTGH